MKIVQAMSLQVKDQGEHLKCHEENTSITDLSAVPSAHPRTKHQRYHVSRLLRQMPEHKPRWSSGFKSAIMYHKQTLQVGLLLLLSNHLTASVTKVNIPIN